MGTRGSDKERRATQRAEYQRMEWPARTDTRSHGEMERESGNTSHLITHHIRSPCVLSIIPPCLPPDCRSLMPNVSLYPLVTLSVTSLGRDSGPGLMIFDFL